MSLAPEPRTVRLLMLCYYYPPIRTSAIARNVGFSRNLHLFGCEPTVLTVSRARDTWGINSFDAPIPADVKIIRTPEINLNGFVDLLDAVINKVFRLKKWIIRELFCIPDPQIAWLAVFNGVLQARKSDCIYVSCSPFSSALIAVTLKAITRKPLIVDFRDAWVLNPYISHTRFHSSIAKWMERIVLRACDRLILNTAGTVKVYMRQYPHYAQKMVCIPNGFDRLEERSFAEDRGGRFTVMHVGSFYGSRNPDLLLEVMSELNLPDTEFVQVGGTFSSYERYKNKVKIRIVESTAPEKALNLMRSASLLYLKQGWMDGVKDYIAVGTKTYEYIATGLPILAECPPGDNVDIVRTYAPISYVVTSRAKEDLRRALNAAYSERLNVIPLVKPEFIQDFDRKTLTGKLADLVKCVVRNEKERGGRESKGC